MKLKKEHIIIIAVCLLCSISFLIIIGGKALYEDRKIQDDNYLILGIDNFWKQRDDKWLDVDNQKEIQNILKIREFSAYSNNKFITKSFLKRNQNKWQYLNNENKLVTIYPSFLAYSSKKGEVDIKNHTSVELGDNDLKIINEYMGNEIMISQSKPLTISEKVVFDFDQDGHDETFYIASDLYLDDFTKDKNAFQIILYEDDNHIQIIRKDIIDRNNEYKDASANKIMTILKFNNQSTYDIILNRYRPMGSLPSCPILLSLKDGEFVEVKTCQEVRQ